MRDEQPTLTDSVELEAARVISTFSSPPPSMEVSVAEVSEDAVVANFESILGSFQQYAVVAVPPEEVTELESKAAFVLSLIDGTLRIEDLVDVAGMPPPETLALLQDLVARGIVSLQAKARPKEAKREPARPSAAFRVIAEGDDSVGEVATIEEAIAIAASARAGGKRHVAVVVLATGALVDESRAQRRR